MTYVITPSTFGIGYSIFRLEVEDGNEVRVYLTDANSVSEARMLCPGATEVICLADENEYQGRKVTVS